VGPAFLEGITGIAGNTVAILDLQGVIASGSGLSGGTIYADTVVNDLEMAANNPAVAAIVLDINSPGGSVFASATIYEAVRACPKPVVAYMGEMAASGGYYIACGSDYILAHPATLTGSIGVIWQFTNAEKLLDMLGVQTQVVKSGQHKDQGGYHRPLTEQELEMYQEIVDEAYEDFLQVVADGRDLAPEQVRELADGRVFSGRQAVELSLADAEGDLDDAIAVAASMGNIEGTPSLLHIQHQPGLLDVFLSYFSSVQRPPEAALLEELLNADAARPQYLYVAP
ncbi:MAG: signal peptide peptidase SppA, partial [Chloroflexi bacterium]|nr:signal peptide peptidase SppA [Chloroflexota bacterium]